jgi:hypothetical protein
LTKTRREKRSKFLKPSWRKSQLRMTHLEAKEARDARDRRRSIWTRSSYRLKSSMNRVKSKNSNK